MTMQASAASAFYYTCFDTAEVGQWSSLQPIVPGALMPMESLSAECSSSDSSSPLLRSLDRDSCVEVIARLIDDDGRKLETVEVVRQCWKEQQMISLFLNHRDHYHTALEILNSSQIPPIEDFLNIRPYTRMLSAGMAAELSTLSRVDLIQLIVDVVKDPSKVDTIPSIISCDCMISSLLMRPSLSRIPGVTILRRSLATLSNPLPVAQLREKSMMKPSCGPLPQRLTESGHPWVYWPEIENIKELNPLPPGSIVRLLGPDGSDLGLGLLNRSSSIPVRVLTRSSPSSTVTEDYISALLRRRAHKAVSRSLALPTIARHRCGRLITGEADGLPGITCDLLRAADDKGRGSILIFKFDTYGEEFSWDKVVRDEVCDSIHDITAVVVHKMNWRKERHGADGKEFTTTLVRGSESVLDGAYVVEGQTHFQLPLMDVHHQSMWPFHEADMRQRLQPCVRGRTVLDVSCGYGGWGIRAAKEGAAAEVVMLDEAVRAVRFAETNSKINGVDDKVSILLRNDLENELEAMAASRLFFDVVILHAYPQIKKRERVSFGQLGRELVASAEGLHKEVQAAVGVVAKGGLLVLHTPLISRAEDKASEQMIIHALSNQKRTGAIEWSMSSVGPSSGLLLGHHDVLYSRTMAVRLT